MKGGQPQTTGLQKKKLSAGGCPESQNIFYHLQQNALWFCTHACFQGSLLDADDSLSDCGRLVNGNSTKLAGVSRPCTLHQDAEYTSFHLADGPATAVHTEVGSMPASTEAQLISAIVPPAVNMTLPQFFLFFF